MQLTNYLFPLQLERIIPEATSTQINNESVPLKTIPEPKASQMRITYENLTYSVKTGKTTKNLLTSVCGSLEPGKLTAIIGASGAGKVLFNYLLKKIISCFLIFCCIDQTTLLNILAGRAKRSGSYKYVFRVEYFRLPILSSS